LASNALWMLCCTGPLPASDTDDDLDDDVNVDADDGFTFDNDFFASSINAQYILWCFFPDAYECQCMTLLTVTF